MQGFLRHDCQVDAIGIDSYALSAHKLQGPKGIGALWTGKRTRLRPILFGGGQEEGLRSGTPNTPGIAGLMAAIEGYDGMADLRALKLRLYTKLVSAIPQLIVNGPPPESEQAADHILNLSFPPVRAETMLHALEGKGVYVGNGAACSSRGAKLSQVLKAMGKQSDVAQCAIRFSLAPGLAQDAIDYAAQAVIDSYALLKPYRRR